MHYVYVLISKKDNGFYVGCSKDLQKRLALHSKGTVPSTTKRRPLELIFYEAFFDQTDAYNREKWLKTGWGRSHLNKALTNHLKSLGR